MAAAPIAAGGLGGATLLPWTMPLSGAAAASGLFATLPTAAAMTAAMSPIAMTAAMSPLFAAPTGIFALAAGPAAQPSFLGGLLSQLKGSWAAKSTMEQMITVGRGYGIYEDYKKNIQMQQYAQDMIKYSRQVGRAQLHFIEAERESRMADLAQQEEREFGAGLAAGGASGIKLPQLAYMGELQKFQGGRASRVEGKYAYMSGQASIEQMVRESTWQQRAWGYGQRGRQGGIAGIMDLMGSFSLS